MTTNSGHRRHRGLYALLIGIVIGLGLGSRSGILPPFLAKYSGDALWALMVFFGIGFLFPTWRTISVAALAVAISSAVEFSQLCHAPWLDAARRTTLGHLALGDTFAWADIAAYLVGIGFGACVEWTVHQWRQG